MAGWRTIGWKAGGTVGDTARSKIEGYEKEKVGKVVCRGDAVGDAYVGIVGTIGGR